MFQVTKLEPWVGSNSTARIMSRSHLSLSLFWNWTQVGNLIFLSIRTQWRRMESKWNLFNSLRHCSSSPTQRGWQTFPSLRKSWLQKNLWLLLQKPSTCVSCQGHGSGSFLKRTCQVKPWCWRLKAMAEERANCPTRLGQVQPGGLQLVRQLFLGICLQELTNRKNGRELGHMLCMTFF